MNDLHAMAAFKALDEGRLQPVDKGEVVVPEAREAAAALQDALIAAVRELLPALAMCQPSSKYAAECQYRAVEMGRRALEMAKGSKA